VLRIREGEEVELFDGRGAAASAVVRTIAKDRVVVEITGAAPSREPAHAIELALALIQPDRFELALQKATELGAASITPLLTARGEVRPDRVAGKRDRWERIILEAVKQSGRSRIPRLDQPAPLDAVLARGGQKIFFDADTSPADRAVEPGATMLLIGPEGGWSEAEVESARRAACIIRRIGTRRLRAETAAIVAVALVARELGELGNEK
jgi:16S rRNA (uracil1498-N3)-methyltransferase